MYDELIKIEHIIQQQWKNNKEFENNYCNNNNKFFTTFT